jgi:hypothetical protein
MNKGKIRGKTPSLIGGTLGAPRKCTVQRRCNCNRCKVDIEKDIDCFEIPQLGGAFTNYKRYCDDCFRSILEQSRLDLNKLLSEAGITA